MPLLSENEESTTIIWSKKIDENWFYGSKQRFKVVTDEKIWNCISNVFYDGSPFQTSKTFYISLF